MKKIFYLFVFSILISAPKKLVANGEIDSFIENLPKGHRIVLEYFARGLLASKINSVGYVLYGDKPMCIAGVDDFGTTPHMKFSYSSDERIKAKAYDLLQELKIPVKNMKFPFVEYKDGPLKHVIFINREAFLKTVNDNIHLFRYILGRTLTAESFLEDLLNSGNDFYNIFKWDKLILGILLGYGTQNALIVSRMEDFSCDFNHNGSGFTFPYREIDYFLATKFTPQQGFKTVKEEGAFLERIVDLSTELKKFDHCSIPHFGCVKDTQETNKLLATYEKNRQKILEVLENGNILKQFLTRLCTAQSGEVIALEDSKKPLNPSFNFEDKEISKKIIECKTLELSEDCDEDSRFKKKDLLEAFIQGARWFQKGKELPVPEWANMYYNIDYIFEMALEEKKIESFFQQIVKQTNVVELIPQAISYKVLLSGKGEAATNKIATATFHCAIKSEKEDLIEGMTLKNAKIDELIPGIGQSFVGMKKGEEREVYIHPSYAYDWLYYRPLTVHVKLLDFELGTEERNFSRILHTELADEIKSQILKNYKRIKGYSYFNQGYNFMRNMKRLSFEIDLDSFFKSKVTSFQNEDERRKFVLDLDCYVFNREWIPGTPPPSDF